MNLQTHISFSKESGDLINYNSSLVLVGSCFSKNIGDKLAYSKFKTTQNPFGILFHPKAIETFISNAIHKKTYSEKDLFFFNERWHCFDSHSQLSSKSKEEVLQNLQEATKLTAQLIKKSTHLIITLGTSWVYRFIESNAVVANCHKVAQHQFTKELLSIDQITKLLKSIIALVKEVNPTINFIFTVSPIRHLKDGFIENQLSKSHLISSLHQVINNKKKIFYFPSYELMMDELRDYRFYKEDMIHPNQIAINYIWEKFSKNWLSEEAINISKEIIQIQKGINHRPFNAESKKHLQFLASIQEKIQGIQKKYPNISF